MSNTDKTPVGTIAGRFTLNALPKSNAKVTGTDIVLSRTQLTYKHFVSAMRMADKVEKVGRKMVCTYSDESVLSIYIHKQ